MSPACQEKNWLCIEKQRQSVLIQKELHRRAKNALRQELLSVYIRFCEPPRSHPRQTEVPLLGRLSRTLQAEEGHRPGDLVWNCLRQSQVLNAKT